MPKKPIFTKEQVYKTAFEVFKIEGIDGISARNLAKSLGASPAPIYSFYSSIDTLKNELLDEAKKLFLDYVKKERTDSPIFLSKFSGPLVFAFSRSPRQFPIHQRSPWQNNLVLLEKTHFYFQVVNLLRFA